MSLENKVIIVAGAASGIGAAVARRLAAQGAKVVVGDLPNSVMNDTVDDIRSRGGIAQSFGFDMTDEASIKAMIEYAVKEFGGLDGLHNNSIDTRNAFKDTNILDVDMPVWQRTFDIGLTGYFLSMRHAIPHMLNRGGGAIVNTSSAAAFSGEPIRPAYGAVKAGVIAITRHVAAAYGAKGIRCNAVAPGAILTENALAAANNAGVDLEATFEVVQNTVMHSHRAGKPEDIGAMVSFLMSEDGAWINGQCISVDGGWIFR